MNRVPWRGAGPSFGYVQGVNCQIVVSYQPAIAESVDDVPRRQIHGVDDLCDLLACIGTLVASDYVDRVAMTGDGESDRAEAAPPPRPRDSVVVARISIFETPCYDSNYRTRRRIVKFAILR